MSVKVFSIDLKHCLNIIIINTEVFLYTLIFTVTSGHSCYNPSHLSLHLICCNMVFFNCRLYFFILNIYLCGCARPWLPHEGSPIFLAACRIL